MENNALLWIILFPLLSSIFIRLYGKGVGRKAVSLIACSSVGVSFVLAVYAVLAFASDHQVQVDHVFLWLRTDQLHTWFRLSLDSLSAVMICVITGVGTLIHVYSTGYMHHEKAFERYFAYLNLFMAMMLILVLADNFLLMFVGWEGVGLCSYLLIGFYYQDHKNADAGKKAFVVNRVGDFAFIVGLLSLFWALGTQAGVWSFDFAVIRDHISSISSVQILGLSAFTFISLMMFIGATGKSAQIPLYVWLPDAMAGPTPVSALIHAATMVTSGIYMICRLSFLFDAAPVTLEVISWIGGLTALFAATMALVQNDIKKVLAYSTVSQLGYMFLACGVGAYASGMFHVVTHAFFKALLFLGAGSVIHACSHEQDMRKMGGLRKSLPITFWIFVIGTLAISGMFPFAGFFSKDEILWQLWNHSKYLWFLAIFTAGLTSFYMFRCLFMTFWGECKLDASSKAALHESPPSMTIPLITLAVLSCVGGWVWWPGFMPLTQFFPHWLESSVIVRHPHGSHFAELLLTALSLLVALGSASMAYVFYVSNISLPQKCGAKCKALYKVFANLYYVDEIYEALFVRPCKSLSKSLSVFDQKYVDGFVNGMSKVLRLVVFIMGSIDRFIVDGLVHFFAYLTKTMGIWVQRIQNGHIQMYLAVLVTGVGFFIALYLGYFGL
ncbi:MAG: NADH-quinone oxidoreductase subunit L [Bdellovibrionales bacterium]|nr:NADH-quinone oxidoreductase subunit L [Bdellovibrionales bacterium]